MKLFTIRDGQSDINLRTVPKTCPKCLHAIQPSGRLATTIKDGQNINVSFHCPACEEMFIGRYKHYANSSYDFVDAEPSRPKKVGFSEEIISTSPSFVDIYNQALAAESYNLNQVVGIALRKSLEFLIKDYLILMKPEKESDIKACLLGPCINNYIDDANIKETARRAVWIGNDETHYVRKWEDRDIQDLKILIRLCVNWIDNHIVTQRYIKEMDKGK